MRTELLKIENFKLTVIFRDDSPMIHCGDSPSYRTVQIELTSEQKKALARQYTHTISNTNYFESISQCILDIC